MIVKRKEYLKMLKGEIRVREMHRMKEYDGKLVCAECYKHYPYYAERFPCPTVRALDGN